MKVKLKLLHNNITFSLDCVQIKKSLYIYIYTRFSFFNIYLYIYICVCVCVCVFSQKLWYMLLGTEYAEYCMVLVDRIYNCFVSAYDDVYLFYLECKL